MAANRSWLDGLKRSCLLALLALTGCTSPAPEQRAFLASDAATRAQAAVESANHGSADASQTWALIGLLSDNDPGVRMYAILALRRLYGDDRGYRYYDGLAERLAAIERWRSAMAEGALTPPAQNSAAGQIQSPASPPTDTSRDSSATRSPS